MVSHLKSERKVGKIGLWGRSMGAVAGILYASQDSTISGMVLDSPFSSLRKVAYEICNKFTKVPTFIIMLLYNRIKKTISEKVNFDLDELNPIDRILTCKQPTIFVTGVDDDFILPSHSKELYNAYKGKKRLFKVDGGHNSTRPRSFMETVKVFFYEHLDCASIPDIILEEIPEYRALIAEMDPYKNTLIDNQKDIIKYALENTVTTFSTESD